MRTMSTSKPSERRTPLWVARHKAGLTRRALSDSSGVPESTIARLEATGAAMRQDTAEKLAGALNTTTDALFGRGRRGAR